MISIYTWNVNGLRACHRKGFLDWLAAEKPQVLCLQETKAHEDQLPPEVRNPDSYRTWFSSARRPGYSGVALYSSIEPLNVEPGLGIQEFDDEGRCIIAEYDNFVLIGCYFPNSGNECKRLPYKLAFDKAVMEKCEKERERGRQVVLCGDFNAAHTEIDLANPKQNEKNAGFLPEERAWVTDMLEKGYIDIFRQQHPGEKDHYTWWSYRARARARNVGWRLDYFLVTPDIAQKTKKVTNLTDVTGSDHCPVRLELDI